MESKICPILSIGTAPNGLYRYCEEADCAWWIPIGPWQVDDTYRRPASCGIIAGNVPYEFRPQKQKPPGPAEGC